MTTNFEFDIDAACVDNIIASKSVEDAKQAAAAFISAADKLDGMHICLLCQKLTASLLQWIEKDSLTPKNVDINAVIIQADRAPIALLLTCVPINGSPIEIVDGLQRFVARCDEFIPPIYDAIPVAEINKVLRTAQKTYRLLDLIAPKEPLKILRFTIHMFSIIRSAEYLLTLNARRRYFYFILEKTRRMTVCLFLRTSSVMRFILRSQEIWTSCRMVLTNSTTH